LILGATVFLAWQLRAQWSQIAAIRPDASWIAAAVGAMAVALWGQVAAWRWNLKVLGACVAFKPLFRVYYTMNLARYIPGKVWSVIGMVAGGTRLGVDPETMSTSVFVGLVSSLVSGLCVGAVTAWAMGEQRLVSLWLMVVPVAALLAVWPPLFRRVATWVLRKLRRNVAVPVVSARLLVRSLLHYGLVWCAYGTAVGVLALSVGSEAFGLYFAIFPLAYLAGYAALFAPGGWGVREGALILLAGGGAVAVAVSLLQRLILTGFELGLFGYSIWSWKHD
jgi:uncharacterized membrane protein YbhN (UPF0104 family)